MIKILLLTLGVIGSIIGLVDALNRITDPEAHTDTATLVFAVWFSVSIVVLSGHIIALIL